jgi:hypothetical protein
MKKIILLILVPYLLVIGVVFYLYFGPGILSGYTPLKWNGITAEVPKDFKVSTYQTDGWEVYYLTKISVMIKIAVKPGIDNVSGFAKHEGNVLFEYTPDNEKTYYFSKKGKLVQAASAAVIDSTAIFFSVSSQSPYGAVYILDKIMANASYKGNPFPRLKPVLPRSIYTTDYIFLAGMLVPCLIILIIFSFSGRRPSGRHFIEDPIRYEETFVYFSKARTLGRANSFCCLVLTSTRLMAFHFRRPLFEIKLKEGKTGIRFDGKKIIIDNGKLYITLRPGDIDKWKQCLMPYAGVIHSGL